MQGKGKNARLKSTNKFDQEKSWGKSLTFVDLSFLYFQDFEYFTVLKNSSFKLC